MISVIIPTYNGSLLLPKMLASIHSQTVCPKEIIIVDSSSMDNTVQFAKEYEAKVISIRKSDFDHGQTRTLGAKRASGDILVFMTQDAVPVHQDCFANLLESFEADSDVAAVYGRQIPVANASLFARHLRQFNYPGQSYVRQYNDKESLGLKVAFLSNSFAAYRKKDLESVGYFKPKLIFGEDMLTAAKLLMAGKKIAYNADAKIFHSHNYSISEEFCRYFDIGVFHEREKWLLKEFGTVQKEGMRYFKAELIFLSGHKKYYLFFVFLLRIFAKYVGYQLGRRHQSFPVWLNQSIGMNHSWWERNS